jgi:uncharacterized protein YjbI with pentapeptide repeats
MKSNRLISGMCVLLAGVILLATALLGVRLLPSYWMAKYRGKDAHLASTNLSFAPLRGANLFGAYLRGSNLYAADLREAQLVDANLRSSNLCAADLGNAEPSGADLTEADLRGQSCGAPTFTGHT